MNELSIIWSDNGPDLCQCSYVAQFITGGEEWCDSVITHYEGDSHNLLYAYLGTISLGVDPT